MQFSAPLHPQPHQQFPKIQQLKVGCLSKSTQEVKTQMQVQVRCEAYGVHQLPSGLLHSSTSQQEFLKIARQVMKKEAQAVIQDTTHPSNIQHCLNVSQ